MKIVRQQSKNKGGIYQLFFIVLFLIGLNVNAQNEGYQFTLKQCVEFAIINNNNLQKSKIEQDIVAAQVAEVKGRVLPQVNASGRFSDNFSLAEQQLPSEIVGGIPGTTVGVAFGNRYSVTGGLDVQQQLVNFQLFQSIKSVNALKDLQNLNVLQSTEDLILNVVQVYIQIQVTTKQIELLEENFRRTNMLVELSDLKLQEGIIRKLDLNQLKVNRTNLTTQIEDAIYTKNEQLRLLKLYMNYPIHSNIELMEKLEDQPPFSEKEALAVESNIQYQLMEKQFPQNQTFR
jgi:outer membrane protein TolC